MKRISPAWVVTAGLSAAAVVYAVACSSTDGPTAPPVNMECLGPDCLPGSDASVPETSTKKDAEAGAVMPDVEVVSQEGRIFLMTEPMFEPFVGANTKWLTAPARVSVGAYGKVFSADSDHDGGFVLKDVPKIEGAPLMIEDIDGGAGIFTTLWPANVPSQLPTFDLAVLPKAAIDQIVQSVSPPVTLDPAKGHLLVTMLNSSMDQTGTHSVKLTATRAAEAVLYLTEGKTWVRDNPTGSTTMGVSLVVNIPADPFPGEIVYLKYTVTGQTGVMAIPFPLKLAAGTINRVYFYASSAVPE